MASVQLNKEQTAAYSAIREKKNIFITGPGGVGKSHLIHYIINKSIESVCFEEDGIDYSKENFKKTHIGLTALTGCAAILLGRFAKTLHSWAGIGLGNGTVKDLCTKIKKNKTAEKNSVAIAKKMTQQQLAKAKKLAQDCLASNFKNCLIADSIPRKKTKN